MRGIRMTSTGGPEVLEYVELDEPAPGPEDVVVELAAAGLNYIDTYQRSGLYPVPLPYTPGLEGAGTIVAVGSEAAGFSIGQRVAWTAVPGSYAERVRVPIRAAVPVPERVASDVAAATMLQGMTAHFLACDTFPLEAGDRCLIHAGAGGVGRILIQIAKLRGAEVFTTVGSAEKAEAVKALGADHVILYRETDFGDAVEAIAGKKAIDVVYDGVGKDTFDRSLELLRRRGMMVTFGNASGPVDPVLPLRLSTLGSLYLTRPTLADYTVTREELLRRAGELFGWIGDGQLDIEIGLRVPLAETAEAHRLLQGRATSGKVLLLP
ncbi:MAG: quinone oxidoreductase [Acidimicrobiales bacterium]|nr:quinone oxidoreductase [Acidimicrobiales bacterium]